MEPATHEVFDRILKEVVFEGSRAQCNNWVAPQPYYHEYVVRPIQGNEETVPNDWWSGGFADNH